MQEHHYLGALAKIGHTLRYVAERDGRWVGLLSVSAPALKCAARDQWIGWDYRHQYDRLNLVANNSRAVTTRIWPPKFSRDCVDGSSTIGRRISVTPC